ncbi:hypothetical protein Tco_0428996 [Tanacetum coccineum]
MTSSLLSSLITSSLDTVEPEDETIPVSVYEVGESSTATIPQGYGNRLRHSFMRRDINSIFGRIPSILRRLCGCKTVHALVEKKGKAKDEFYGKLILGLGNEVRSSVEEGVVAMENLVRRLGNVEERAECEKLKKELEEASSITRKKGKERFVKADLDLKKDQNEAIRLSDSAPLTQASVRRMIKENVDAAIAVERARHANAGNDARGSGPVRGQDTTPIVHECTFAGFMKCNPTVLRGTEGAVELQRWFEKTESAFGISECEGNVGIKSVLILFGVNMFLLKLMLLRGINTAGEVQRKYSK